MKNLQQRLLIGAFLAFSANLIVNGLIGNLHAGKMLYCSYRAWTAKFENDKILYALPHASEQGAIRLRNRQAHLIKERDAAARQYCGHWADMHQSVMNVTGFGYFQNVRAKSLERELRKAFPNSFASSP